MVTRREMLHSAGLMVVGLAASSLPSFGKSFLVGGSEFVSRRPPLDKRRFSNPSVEALITEVKEAIADPELAWMFENCYPNTLDTTVTFSNENGKPDTFVITGDIDAMWLRDSTAQVWPYLPIAKTDMKMRELLAGVINHQTKCILIDPYANAFNLKPTGSYWEKDLTDMKKELHERKWEIDSICYPIRLAYGYWKTTGDSSPFDDQWQKAMRVVVRTFREQQRLKDHGPYKFQRETTVSYDTVPLGGYGNPTKPCGLIHSAFRPSDDACIFLFLIPSNLFASTVLRYLSEIFLSVVKDAQFAQECQEFSKEVGDAVKKYGIMSHKKFGRIYAYEVDGFGNALFMDDANVPNLLSLPYLDCCTNNDPVYLATEPWF